MHVLMFWGFLMLSTDMFDLASGNRFSEHLLPEVINPLWNGMVELGYTSALIGCFLALNRRVLFTPEKLKGKSQLEGNVILLLIMTITLTSYIVEAGEELSGSEFIGLWVQDAMSPNQAMVNLAYWAHMVAISTFLFLIPVSKHMHLVMALPNVFFHDLRPMGTMLPMATNEDGTAVDPIAFRDAIMADPDKRAALQEDKELFEALSGDDTARIQACLKKLYAQEKRYAEQSANDKMNSSDILRAGCSTPRDVTVLYENMLKVGLQYGPSFRLLSQVWVPDEIAQKQNELAAAETAGNE